MYIERDFDEKKSLVVSGTGERGIDCGSTPGMFAIALLVVIVWALTGPLFHYSDTWQLVINTGTTIVTFLMVFLIQNTQNRDTQAVQLKLDELIRVTKGAHNLLIDLEELDDEQVEQLRRTYERLGKIAREKPKSD